MGVRIDRDGRKDPFWDRVEEVNGCLVWIGALTSGGYGATSRRGVNGAHRVGWVLMRGKEPLGELVNVCGNRACCNADHWWDSGKGLPPYRTERRMIIVRLYRAGRSLADIAKIVGVDRTTAMRNLRGIRQ